MFRHMLLAAGLAVLFTAPAYAGGFHWVRPHQDSLGRSYPGHLQGNPDGNPWNNLNPPTNRQLERQYFPTMRENWGRTYGGGLGGFRGLGDDD